MDLTFTDSELAFRDEVRTRDELLGMDDIHQSEDQVWRAAYCRFA